MKDKVFMIILLPFLSLFPFTVFANAIDLVAPLLPGDIIFSTGEIGGAAGPRFGAKALHGHLSIYLGKKDEFSRYLRVDQVDKYINNWELRDYNPFYEVAQDDIIVFDLYPKPVKKGTYVRFRKITSRFFYNASGKKYPVPISQEQREKILQFLFDNVEVYFDLHYINNSSDKLWTCNELCEAAYSRAGASIMRLMGVNYRDFFRVNVPLLDEQGNASLPHVLAFYLMDFTTIEVSNNFTEYSGIKYYAVKLDRGYKFYNGNKTSSIIRIRHDLAIVNIFCDLFGFKQTIAGPFDTETKAIQFIVANWDEGYGQYLETLRAK